MDNNKIVDNLNFTKIYFRVFVYKIIIPEKAWIIQKRDKNHRLRMKTHLGTRTGLKKKKKTLKRESKTHQNTEERSASKSTIRHFWSAKQHFKRAKWSPFGLWPNSLQMTIRHTIFDLFVEGCVRICILIVHAYFLESSGLYK